MLCFFIEILCIFMLVKSFFLTLFQYIHSFCGETKCRKCAFFWRQNKRHNVWVLTCVGIQGMQVHGWEKGIPPGMSVNKAQQNLFAVSFKKVGNLMFVGNLVSIGETNLMRDYQISESKPFAGIHSSEHPSEFNTIFSVYLSNRLELVNQIMRH